MKKVILVLSLLLILLIGHTAVASEDKILAELQSTVSFLQKKGCKRTTEGNHIVLLCPGEIEGLQPQVYIAQPCRDKKDFSLRVLVFGQCMEPTTFKIGKTINPYAWCISNDSGQAIYSYLISSDRGDIHIYNGNMVIAQEESEGYIIPILTPMAKFSGYDNDSEVTRVTIDGETFVLCGRYPLCSYTQLAKGKEYSLYLLPPDKPCFTTPELTAFSTAFSQVLGVFNQRLSKINFTLRGDVLSVQTAMVELTIDPEMHLVAHKFPITLEAFRSASQSIQKEIGLARTKSTTKTAKTSAGAGVKAGLQNESVGTDIEDTKSLYLQQVIQQRRSKNKSLNFGEAIKADLLPRFILWVSRNVYPYNVVSLTNLAEYPGVTQRETTVVATALFLADLYYHDYDSLSQLIKAFLALEVL